MVVSASQRTPMDLRRWRNEIQAETKDLMRARLNRIKAFRDLPDDQKRDEFCAIFDQDQINRVIQLDEQRGYNLDDVQDCLDALNALEKREKRAIFKRMRDRISVFGYYQTRKAKAVYAQKTGDVDIFASSSSLLDFENTDGDFELLQYIFIGEHSDIQMQMNAEPIDKPKLIRKIVQEFCPHEVKDSDP